SRTRTSPGSAASESARGAGAAVRIGRGTSSPSVAGGSVPSGFAAPLPLSRGAGGFPHSPGSPRGRPWAVFDLELHRIPPAMSNHSRPSSPHLRPPWARSGPLSGTGSGGYGPLPDGRFHAAGEAVSLPSVEF